MHIPFPSNEFRMVVQRPRNLRCITKVKRGGSNNFAASVHEWPLRYITRHSYAVRAVHHSGIHHTQPLSCNNRQLAGWDALHRSAAPHSVLENTAAVCINCTERCHTSQAQVGTAYEFICCCSTAGSNPEHSMRLCHLYSACYILSSCADNH